MEVFVVVHEDRHFNVQVHVFEEEAWAMKLVSRICADYGEFQECLTPEMEADGYTYNAILNPDEGAMISVQRKVVLNSETASFDKEH